MKRRPFKIRSGSKGQSFVELMLMVLVLVILVAGIAEYGLLLNQYLNLLDGAREAVRYTSNFNPFQTDGSVDPAFYSTAADLSEAVMRPVQLNPGRGDDIVVSFFSAYAGNISRYPDENGWSKYSNQVSRQSSASINSKIDSAGPRTGVLLIEIYYHYSQTLKLPVFTALVPDPIPVYVYAIMPLVSAEVTPSP